MLIESLDHKLLRKLLIDWAHRHPCARFIGGSEIVACDYFLFGAAGEYLKSKGAYAPGLDGETKRMWRKYPELMVEWTEEVLDGRYHPRPIRGVERPKPDGGHRPIGIPALRDRCIQKALYWVLEPLYETLFMDCSYAYRLRRSPYDATTAIVQEIETNDFRYLSKCDIENCFGSFDYNILLAALRRRIDDPVLERLIMEQAQCPIHEHGRWNGATKGIAQGGVLSPLLCNATCTRSTRWS